MLILPEESRTNVRNAFGALQSRAGQLSEVIRRELKEKAKIREEEREERERRCNSRPYLGIQSDQ